MALGSAIAPGHKSDRASHLSSLQVPQLSIPSFFLCPISLELMSDPVTLSTGMTYDRANIEKWLASGHNRCPSSNQVLADDQEFIPNHTLRRLIQEWCTKHKAYGVERIPTPKQSVAPERVRHLLCNVDEGYDVEESLKTLRSLAMDSERNRRSISEAGAAPILASFLATLDWENMSNDEEEQGGEDELGFCEEAVGVVALLHLGDEDTREFADERTLACLCWLVTSFGCLDAKVNAAELICKVCELDPRLKGVVGGFPGAIEGLVTLLLVDRDRELGFRAEDVGLRLLLSLCIVKKNRLEAIECNAVGILVDLIGSSASEQRNNNNNNNNNCTEHAYALLEVLANCAEGREAISSHALAIPAIVRSLLGVSDVATEHATATLWAVLSYSSNRSVINAALQAGAFTKLLMLLPSNCSQRTKHKARDTLKLLNQVWGTHTCRPAEGSSDQMSGRRDQFGQVRPSTGFW